MQKIWNTTNNQIPKDWVIKTLPEFSRIEMGQSPLSNTYNFDGRGLPFFQGKAEFGEFYPKVNKYCSEPKKIAEEGAVLLSVRAPVGPTNLAKEKSCIGRGLAALHPLDGMDSKFLLFLLRSIEPELSSQGTGSTFKAITKGFVENMAFAIPDIREQEHIITKIEELFSELDSGIASLKTAQEQLKIYRQALLKHAFEGKLTEQWRKDNTDQLETPEQLLARIQTERETRYQQQLDEWKQAVKDWEAKGKEGKKPSKPTKFKPTQNAEEQDFQIPTKWALAELSTLAYESVLGKMLDKQKNTGVDQDYLGNINVRWGYFDLNNLKQMKIEETEESRYSLNKGDLVVCEGGEPGRCAIWKGENGVIFIQKALHRIRFTESYLPTFAYYYLTYAVPLERVVKHFTGTTIKHLTGTGLGKVQFPICSLAEQQEIVSQLEEKLSIIEQNEKEIESALAKAELLRQSILKRAFSGQLFC